MEMVGEARREERKVGRWEEVRALDERGLSVSMIKSVSCDVSLEAEFWEMEAWMGKIYEETYFVVP
jgi:hypothetical protein